MVVGVACGEMAAVIREASQRLAWCSFEEEADEALRGEGLMLRFQRAMEDLIHAHTWSHGHAFHVAGSSLNC